MAITIYSKPSCVQCTATYRAMKGIDYTVVDMSVDEEALAMVKGLGHLGAPVVVTEDDSWSGFNPLKIAELKQKLSALVAA